MALPPQTVCLLQAARQMAEELPADAVLLLSETALDWEAVRDLLNGCRLLVVGQEPHVAEQLREVPGLTIIDVDGQHYSVHEQIGLALLEAVASEELRSGAHVIALFNGVEVKDSPDQIDSLSIIHLGEHLERLTAQELRRLNTRVPLETLKAVIDLATEIGREGREGKPVGTLFVVGDTRKVLTMTEEIGFDPVRGYSRRERNLRDRRVREAVKEIAKLDGAIIVNRDGTVEAAARYLDVKADGITLSKGLGSRHWTGAAISKRTQALAVAVSESSGTVRIFQNGEIVLRIEPFARPMVWRQFQLEGADGEDVLPGTLREAKPES